MKNIRIIILTFLVLFILSGCSTQNSSSYESSDNKEYFNGYECTDDCSGHEAGYNWADEKGIDDIGDCGGKSQSFIEGCESYVEENY